MIHQMESSLTVYAAMADVGFAYYSRRERKNTSGEQFPAMRSGRRTSVTNERWTERSAISPGKHVKGLTLTSGQCQRDELTWILPS